MIHATGKLRAVEEIKMSELSTTQTELVKKTNDCEIKPTAMELILERALENDVDLERLKSLLELREKEIKRQERQNFVRDLSAMQMEYKNIEQNAINTHTKSSIQRLINILMLSKNLLQNITLPCSLVSKTRVQMT